MRKLFVLLALGLIHFSQAQEKIRIDLKNEFRAPDNRFDPLPLYKLPGNGRIAYSYTKSPGEYQVTLPEGLSGDLAFTNEFFTGRTDAKVEKNVLIIVADYKANGPKLFVDYNGNFDLTDDGPPVLLNREANGETNIVLHRTDNPDATYTIRLAAGFLNSPRDQSFDDKWKGILEQNPMHGDAELIDIRYWPGSKRQNMVSASVNIDGKKARIGVMDWDCNGLFNDPDDRLIIGDYSSEYLSFNEHDGAVTFSKEPLYQIGNQVYEVLRIDPAGRFLEMTKTDRKKVKVLKVGDVVADLEFKLINGEKTSVHQFLEKGKYTLIDVWGTWCKPCVSKLPEIKTFYEKYRSELNMVAIAYDNLADVQKFVKERNVMWPNGMFTKEIIDELKVEGYPYLVLLNDQGEVVLLGSRDIDEIEAELKKLRG